jgi:hypothetical protein
VNLAANSDNNQMLNNANDTHHQLPFPSASCKNSLMRAMNLGAITKAE